MAFTAKDVQLLRERTGCGMMDCKKALTDTDGDMDKAVELLREKGLAAAAKKSERIAAEGIVEIYIDKAKKTGVIIEVNSETDFVAKNDSFKQFVAGCAKIIAEQNPSNVEALLALNFGNGRTVLEELNDKILTIGEKISVRRFNIYQGVCAGYVHGGGKSAALLKIETDDAVSEKDEIAEMGRNICMQIVAMTPAYISAKEVPAETVENEKKILAAQIKNDPANAKKPENIVEKMVIGRISKFFEQICLENQAYVKDQKISVAKYVEDTAAIVGGKISLDAFVMYERGEGLEKREDNFAAEVAGMVK